MLTLLGPFYTNHHGDPSYRSCDFCFQSATADIWAGILDESRWRQFFDADGTCICSRCLNNKVLIEE